MLITRSQRGRGGRRKWQQEYAQTRFSTSNRNPFGLHVHGRRKGRGNVAVLGGQRDRQTRVLLITVVPRKSTSEWMVWLRAIGLEFVDIIVTADNVPSLTSLVESWSTIRANEETGWRMIIENSSVGRSKSNGIFWSDSNCAGNGQNDFAARRKNIGR